MAKYIWYSGATDVTGQALADALSLTGIKGKPKTVRDGDIIVGWGAKTKQAVNIAKATVLNHPDKIKANRNKIASLTTMYANKDLKATIVPFCGSGSITSELSESNPTMKLPIIGRTNYHQGGKGFWTCINSWHIQRAIDDGAQYFQNYIDIKDEYRLHVAFGNVIYAVKKVENPAESGWIAQRKEKILNIAEKNNTNLEEATIDYVLGRLAKEADLPDRIVRSNKRGWKFSGVQLKNVSTSLQNAAKKAVEVTGLDFGAVDCAVGLDNLPYIIEINSGPGLQGTALQKYVDAFATKIDSIENPKPGKVKQAVDRVRNAVGSDKTKEAEAPSSKVNDTALVHLMNAVNSPEEARKILDLMN